MRTDVRLFLAVVVPAILVYSATASWAPGDEVDQDVFTTTVTAHRIGTTGSPVAGEAYRPLVGEPFYGVIGWFRDGSQGVIGKYPPGAALPAAPLYALVREAPPFEFVQQFTGDTATVPLPAIWVSTLAAVLSTAAAMGVLGVTFARLVDRRPALFGAWVAAFGTSAWGAASEQLFQHGPNLLWLSLAGLAAAKGRDIRAGAWSGLAVLTRPHTAFVAAGLGLGRGWQERSLKPVVSVAVPALAGLGLLIAYNAWFFSAPGVRGGYEESLTQPTGSGIPDVVVNYLGALFSPRFGVLVWSPFLVLGVIGLWRAWDRVPRWAKGAALGGLAYLVVQFTLNRYNPGDVVPYRYPLEGLVAAAPALFLGTVAWFGDDPPPWRQNLFFLLVAWSVLGQALAANN